MQKKTEKADLEGKRAIFFQVGLIIALLIAVIAINYESHAPKTGTITVKATGIDVRTANGDTVPAVRPPEIAK